MKKITIECSLPKVVEGDIHIALASAFSEFFYTKHTEDIKKRSGKTGNKSDKFKATNGIQIELNQPVREPDELEQITNLLTMDPEELDRISSEDKNLMPIQTAWKDLHHVKLHVQLFHNKLRALGKDIWEQAVTGREELLAHDYKSYIIKNNLSPLDVFHELTDIDFSEDSGHVNFTYLLAGYYLYSKTQETDKK